MKKNKLPAHVARTLWSYDLKTVNIKRDKHTIITSALNYGNWESVKWLKKTYGMRSISNVVKNPDRGVWLKDVLNYWCTMLQIKLSETIYKHALRYNGPMADGNAL